MNKKNNNSLFSKIFFVIIGIIVAVALYSYLHPKEKKEISFICNENNSKIKIGETIILELVILVIIRILN